MNIINEDIFYEGGPANGDLIINLMAGITLIGLPFTFGALVRAFWVRYKITTRRKILFYMNTIIVIRKTLPCQMY